MDKVAVIGAGAMGSGTAQGPSVTPDAEDGPCGHAWGENKALGSLRRSDRPVIAGICGYAPGGGLELAIHCDIRIAAEDAQIGVPEINLGAFPAAGGTQMLPRLVGTGLAKEMLFGGEPISGQEGYRIGLVNKVFTKGRVLEESLKMAKTFAEKPAYAIRVIKGW